MNLFAQQDIRNYWFETGTPTFLLKLIKEKKFTAFDIENSYISTNLLETEILTIKGRIDAVVNTDDDIFILEFKIDQSAQKAIEQIKEKNYAQKYKDDKRPISLLGINFDTDKKMIDDYIIERR